jgi:hypothetical protein
VNGFHANSNNDVEKLKNLSTRICGGSRFRGIYKCLELFTGRIRVQAKAEAKFI